jgi:hypothetical protein
MRAFSGDSELDAAIRRTVQSERYPTPTQRAEAWQAIRARAALQTVLPVESMKVPWSARLCAGLAAVGHVLWSSRSVLLEEAAYRRARREDVLRNAAWLRSPYVQFQPMW